MPDLTTEIRYRENDAVHGFFGPVLSAGGAVVLHSEDLVAEASGSDRADNIQRIDYVLCPDDVRIDRGMAERGGFLDVVRTLEAHGRDVGSVAFVTGSWLETFLRDGPNDDCDGDDPVLIRDFVPANVKAWFDSHAGGYDAEEVAPSEVYFIEDSDDDIYNDEGGGGGGDSQGGAGAGAGTSQPWRKSIGTTTTSGSRAAGRDSEYVHPLDMEWPVH